MGSLHRVGSEVDSVNFMGEIVYIYGLVDPRNGEVRYIGKTVNPSHRLCEHLRDARTKQNHRARWIACILRDGITPLLRVLQEATAGTWSEIERQQIATHREAGCRLTNGNAGGLGSHNPTEEARGKMRASAQKRSPEHRAKLSMARQRQSPPTLGQKRSAETRAKIAENSRNISDETRAKRSVALKGRVMSVETRDRMSAAAQDRSPEVRQHMRAAQLKRRPVVITSE